jgi:hypothetical protein
MAKRLESVFYSEKGQDYTIEIHDKDYSGSVLDFDVIECSLKYDAGGDEDNRFVPVISSELELNMFINSSNLDQFVEDLIVSPEDRFYIVIKAKDENDDIQFRWIGYILSDLISIEDIAIDLGYNFTIKAKDGLNRLKNFDYNNNGVVYTGKQTLLGHVINCLLKIDFALIEYFTANDYLITYATNWISDEGGTENTLTSARVSHRAFYHIDNKGNYIYKSCYDVLSEICKSLGARIVSSGTGFYLTQINVYSDAANVTEYKYNALTQGITSEVVSYSITHNQSQADTTPIYRLFGGNFEFYAPLQYVQVDYTHIATRNLWVGDELSSSIQTPVIIEDIDSGQGTATIQFDFKLEYKSNWIDTQAGIDPTPRQDHFIIYKATVKVGDNYWVNTYTQDVFSVEFTTAQWSVTAGFFYFVTDIMDANDQLYFKNYQILAVNVPGDGDMTINLEIDKVRANGQDLPFIYEGQSTSNQAYAEITYNASAIYIQNIVLGTFATQNDINRYQSTNNIKASKPLMLTTFIGDGPNINSPGHLEVNDGSDWVLSENWSISGGDSKPISQLLANEIIKGQITPVRKFANMPFMMNNAKASFLQPHYAISYDSSYWVFIQGTINFSIDKFQGEWFKVQSSNNYIEEPLVFLDRDYQNVSSSGSVGQSGSIGGGSVIGGGGENSGANTQPSAGAGSLGAIFQEVFTADGTQDTFTVTENDGVLPSNADDIMITRNGQWINANYISSLSSSTGTISLTFIPDEGDRIVIIWINRGDLFPIVFQEIIQGDGIDGEFTITKNDGRFATNIKETFIMLNGLFVDYKRIAEYYPNQGKLVLNFVPDTLETLAFVWFKEVPPYLSVIQENLIADGTQTDFSLSSNDGKLPQSKDSILVLRNGQHINNDYIDGYNPTNGIITLSFTPDEGDEISFVLFYTEIVALPLKSKMYQEQFTTDGVANYLEVTKGNGKLPKNIDSIMIYRNGQFINNAFVSLLEPEIGKITFSFTPRLNEKFTIVWAI